jgi:dihydroorotase
MHYDLLIKNGTLVTPKKTFKADIAVKNGKIADIGRLKKSDTADDIYDADGKHILSGIIDAHVHFRDPGLTGKEDFETGSMAAAFGGITMIADMPNTLPPTSTIEYFNEKVNIAKEKSCIDFSLFALLSDNLSQIEGLKKAGAIGFKVFLGTSTGDIAAPNAGVLFEQMKKCASLGMRIGVHAENGEINSHFTSLCKNKSPDGILLSEARPIFSEVLAIQNAICYAKYTGAKIHIHHVTSIDGALLVAEAKKDGIDISAETCPHYLLLDAKKCSQKVYPPIRRKKHRKGLWDALNNGIIDMIASDHAPHTAHEKELPLWQAPAGLCTVETFVPLMLNEINKGKLSLNDFARLASEAPAKIWGIYPRKGSLLSGADADFTIIDLKKKIKIDREKLHSKSRTTPFDGMEVRGIPVSTVVRGKFVVRDCEFTGTKGYGCLIKPRPASQRPPYQPGTLI